MLSHARPVRYRGAVDRSQLTLGGRAEIESLDDIQSIQNWSLISGSSKGCRSSIYFSSLMNVELPSLFVYPCPHSQTLLSINSGIMRGPFVAVALLGSACSARNVGVGASLDPVQAVLLPDGASAKNPLAHVGANGPWHIGKWHQTGVESFI